MLNMRYVSYCDDSVLWDCQQRCLVMKSTLHMAYSKMGLDVSMDTHYYLYRQLDPFVIAAYIFECVLESKLQREFN